MQHGIDYKKMKKGSYNNRTTRTLSVYLTCDSENVVHGVVNDTVFAKLQSVPFLNKDVQQSARLVKVILNGKETSLEESKQELSNNENICQCLV